MRDMEFWLITTDHLEDRLLFKGPKDFRVGMNYVAVQANRAGVIVLAFILMSNHVHFVVYGTREQVEQFITGFKGAYSRYLWVKYGIHEVLRRNDVDYRKVPNRDEALEWAVAYVQMNAVAAKICSHPSEYPWGTGSTFFQVPVGESVERLANDRRVPLQKHDRYLETLSARERYRLLHTKLALPGKWVISEDGIIRPESYVDKDWVETLYRTPSRMNYFLRNSSKAKQRLSKKDENLPAFRDQVIRAAIPDLCRSLFGKESVEELTENQLVELMRQVRFRFASNVNQIARVTGMSYERAAELLDRE